MTTSAYPTFPSEITAPQARKRRFLAGWKDIANYLAKGVRTVQRYERQSRLPVYRPAGKARGAVIAFQLELDRWVSATPMRGDTVGLDPRFIQECDGAISNIHRRGRDGQRTAPIVDVGNSLQARPNPDLIRSMERHHAIATEQKARARKMIEQARRMCERAIEIRKSHHLILHVDGKRRLT